MKVLRCSLKIQSHGAEVMTNERVFYRLVP